VLLIQTEWDIGIRIVDAILLAFAVNSPASLFNASTKVIVIRIFGLSSRPH
jgi:hypothetical protein